MGAPPRSIVTLPPEATSIAPGDSRSRTPIPTASSSAAAAASAPISRKRRRGRRAGFYSLILDLRHHPRLQGAAVRGDGDAYDFGQALAGGVGPHGSVKQSVQVQRLGEFLAEGRVAADQLEEAIQRRRVRGPVKHLLDEVGLFRRHDDLDLAMQACSSLRPRKRSELIALTLVRLRWAMTVTVSRS